MHFITFPVASTNIFPLVNSKQGGQYVTEYNLKSRDMVATNPSVKYAVGPSFIHSLEDFEVKVLEDSDIPEYSATQRYDKGDYCRYNNNSYICIERITVPEPFNPNHWEKTTIAALHSIIQVNPGRAVINGHFIESLSPVTIDLNATNAELIRQSQEPLYGNLSIGFRTYFSTDVTMSGSMLIENTDNMYLGIQLVIEKSANFKTPNDVPTNQNAVTADLKLADFTYVNGTVSPSSIKMNPEATRYIPSDRISDFDNILNDKYVTSANLIDRMFYTFSGSSGWCDSTDNLMIWDADSAHRQTTEAPVVPQADFYTDLNGNVHFIIPHKQQDAVILNDNNERLYYADRDIPLPTANYATGSSGIVNAAYTEKIKEVASVLNTYKQFTNGKQITYWDTLTVDSTGATTPEFPRDLSSLDVGDYILVREDYTVASADGTSSGPSTMYFVLPGGVVTVSSVNMTTEKPLGIRLGVPQVWYQGEHNEPTTSIPNDDDLLDMFAYTSYRGRTNDYFEIEWHYLDELDNPEHSTPKHFYYPVTSVGPKTWSAAILLTGGIPLAGTSQIGGFFNVSNSADYTDAGYVYLDNTGHLRLMDYGLLRSGTLAYQLGDDYRVPANSTITYIQEYLDENVNARIAFKTNATLTSTPTMLNVYITLTAGDEGVINLYNIDSRFGTGIYLHISADDTTADYSNIIINISDCQKIRIDNSITSWVSGPMINLFRTCLYYDAGIINYIRTCDINNQRSVLFSAYTNFTGFDDLTLWYSRFTTSDPDLIINGMEISQPDVSMTTEEINFWSESVPGDNHYYNALRSITLSGSGSLIACSLYVSNGSTRTINTTQHTIIGGKYKLPQSNNLNYPLACVDHPLKVTGVFTTAYLDNTESHWITTETSFTALTGIYNSATGMGDGSIAFNSKTDLIDTTYTNVDTIGGWEPGSYHIFYGGTTV